MGKRLCSAVLAILMAAAFMVQPAAAATAPTKGQESADFLYDLGLFRGTGMNAEGLPVFELERAPSRIEALVMLLRLMGLEQQALASGYSHPFKDVVEWSGPYVSYAYQKGLTKGISNTQFGGEGQATAAMYVTFVLRALGYKDSGDSPDFIYAQAVDFGHELGLVDEGIFLAESFTRGDVAIVSESALSQPLRGQSKILYEKLQEDGALKNSARWNADHTALTLPVNRNNEESSLLLSYLSLMHFFPQTAKVLFTSSTPEDSSRYSSYRYSLSELRFIEAMSLEKYYGEVGWVTDSTVLAVSGTTIYLTDSQYKVIAMCKVPENLDSVQNLTFTVGVTFDGAKLSTDYYKIIDTVAQNWGKNTFELGEERYEPGDDGSGLNYIRIVKMNGSYVSDGWYRSCYSYSPGSFTGTEENLRDLAESAMVDTFFFSDKTFKPYSDSEWENICLTESEFQYPRITEPGAPASRGFRFYEHNSWDRIIYFFTKDGVYLGQTLIPKSQ